MTAIKPLRVQPMHMPHHSRQIPFRRPKTNMIVIAHQTVRKDFYSPIVRELRLGSQETPRNLLLKKGRLPSGAPVHNVIDRPKN